jgi:hypothetical protein
MAVYPPTTQRRIEGVEGVKGTLGKFTDKAKPAWFTLNALHPFVPLRKIASGRPEGQSAESGA